MPRDRVSRLLDEFSAVTNAAPRPESPARRMIMRNRFPVATRRLATDRFRALRRRLLAPTHANTIDTDPALRTRWIDVCAAMGDLSSLERTALVMTALQGASYEEAGHVLGTTPGALRAAVSRARAKLENA